MYEKPSKFRDSTELSATDYSDTMDTLPSLQDPSNQIRLLKPRPTAPGEILSFDISVWDLDKAPPYNAISYTWGDPDEPSEIPKLLREEAEQAELVERLEKYLQPDAITQESHDEFGAWLDDIEPGRNVAHMELYAMFGRPLWRDCITEGGDPDPQKTAHVYRTLETFDFSMLHQHLATQKLELNRILGSFYLGSGLTQRRTICRSFSSANMTWARDWPRSSHAS